MRPTKKRGCLLPLILALTLLLSACGAPHPPAVLPQHPPQTQTHPQKTPPVPTPTPEAPPREAPEAHPPSEAPAPPVLEAPKRRGIVVIDPGHQLHGDPDTEPIGPGAVEEKARVSSGTRGSFTGFPEHELNLAVALLLREELTKRGYEVFLTREEADVSISNAERAEFANSLDADAFVRIHANGSEDPSHHGAMTICMTPDNPYHPEVYVQSRALSEAVLDAFCTATGAVKETVWETDTMSGINYCRVPVTIVEMGYMTNQEEDELLATASYQQLAAKGIADGIDTFLGGHIEE